MTDQTAADDDPIVVYLTMNQFASGQVILDRAWTADREPRHLTLGALRDLRTERDIWKQRALDLQAAADQLRRQLDAAEAAPCRHSDAITAADLLHYPVGTHRDVVALWCAHCGDPTSPLAPMPFWTEYDAAEQVTELTLANLVAIAEQHEQQHHAEEAPVPCRHPEPRRIIGGVCGDCTIIPELSPGPLAAAVAEARADIAADPAEPEPAPIRHAWLIEAGDD